MANLGCWACHADCAMACTDDMNDSPYDQYNRMANYPESPRLDNDDFMENGRHAEQGNRYGHDNEEGTESEYEDEPEDDGHGEAPTPAVEEKQGVMRLLLWILDVKTDVGG